LISRERYGYKSWWAPFIVEPTQAISFVMSRKMLLGIRERAERSSLFPLVVGEAVGREELHDVASLYGVDLGGRAAGWNAGLVAARRHEIHARRRESQRAPRTTTPTQVA
jgi:hypothetical protein